MKKIFILSLIFLPLCAEEELSDVEFTDEASQDRIEVESCGCYCPRDYYDRNNWYYENPDQHAYWPGRDESTWYDFFTR